MTAGAGVNRLPSLVVRRHGGRQHVTPGTGAWIDPTPLSKLGKRAVKPVPSRTLVIWRMRPADIRPFIPVESRPAQVLARRLGKFRPAALGIDVFIAIDQPSTSLPGALPCRAKRRIVPEVQKTRRCRRNSSAISLGAAKTIRMNAQGTVQATVATTAAPVELLARAAQTTIRPSLTPAIVRRTRRASPVAQRLHQLPGFSRRDRLVPRSSHDFRGHGESARR